MGMGWDDGKPNMGRDGGEIDGLGRQGDSWQRRSRLLASVHMSIVLLLVASIYSIVCLSVLGGTLKDRRDPQGPRFWACLSHSDTSRTRLPLPIATRPMR